MTSMQDISFQLMQSPRELASWNFPLSQILEAYFDLLPEPCKIHYGEAALVIQNSVNAYIRRLEDLYGETTGLCQKLVIELNVNNKRCLLQDKKSNKKLINFNQFELIDFNNIIGKNLNIKSCREKSIKFLHQCFSQLENLDAKLHTVMLDIHGDVIGKKYDFRCNQKMTNSGVLVEEFIPKVFTNGYVAVESTTEKNFGYFKDYVTIPNNINVNENLNALETKNNNSTILPNNLSRDNCQTTNSDCSGCFSTNSNELPDQNFIVSKDLFERIQKSSSKHYENVEHHNMSENNVMNNEICNSVHMGAQTDCLRLEVSGSSRRKSNIVSSEETIIGKMEDVVYNKHDNQLSEKFSKIENDVYMRKSLVEGNDKRRNIDTSTSNFIHCRSERFQIDSTSFECHTLNREASLKSIPFIDGIPKKVATARKKFRLPCPVNLLKLRLTRRNRKILNTKKKISCSAIGEVVENDQILSITEGLKSSIYSPSRQQISTMKEENQNELRGNYNDTFKIRQSFIINYKPVTTFTMDLLGFHPNYNDENAEMIYSGRTTSLLSDINSLSSQHMSSPPPSPSHMTPPISPFLHVFARTKNDKYKKRKLQNRKYKRYFENLIKSKIKKIYEELDLHTDEDQNVARWHAEIKPILQEAERKPPFQIHEYGARILHKLKNTQRKLQFDEIVFEQSPSEVARYFSAILQLASTNNLNINTNEDPHHSIELILSE